MMAFFRSALGVTRRNFWVWRSFMLASIVGHFVEPLLYLVALGYGLGRIVPPWSDMSYAEFVAPGLVVSTVMHTATFECTLGCFGRMETRKVFDAILATPVTVSELVFGEVAWGSLKASLGAAVVLTVITAFGLVSDVFALGVLPLALVAGITFSSMAMAVTALARSFEPFNYYFVAIIAPMFLFSGIFFPLERAPTWAASLAQILPLTHIVAVARWLVRGGSGPVPEAHLLCIVAFAIVSYGTALVLMRRRLTS